MYRIRSEQGVKVSYETQGSGPPLVLVHGGFSDHRTNWEFVLSAFSQHFTVYTVARRGRGETEDTGDRTVEAEALDVAAVVRAAGRPVSLLGHSYGAHVALCAASFVPDLVSALVLYEPPLPSILGGGVPAPMVGFAQAGDWDRFSYWFFRNVLRVPGDELDAVRASALWEPIVADAEASLGDLRALSRYDFQPQRFAGLRMPVLLQAGSESPRDLYATDALARVLGNARIGVLEGQAHEGMTTSPVQYAAEVIGFLTGGQASLAAR